MIFSGTVLPGKQLGHQIGFPTANLVLQGEKPALAHGVYAAWVTLADGTRHPAVVNLGVRPTVEEQGDLWIESHLLDFNGNLYGENITVQLCRFLRPEQHFESLDALKQAITRNVEETRVLLCPAKSSDTDSEMIRGFQP